MLIHSYLIDPRRLGLTALPYFASSRPGEPRKGSVVDKAQTRESVVRLAGELPDMPLKKEPCQQLHSRDGKPRIHTPRQAGRCGPRKAEVSGVKALASAEIPKERLITTDSDRAKTVQKSRNQPEPFYCWFAL